MSSALRQEAIHLIESILEERLPTFIMLMRDARGLIGERKPSLPKKPIDLSKYVGHGSKMFKSTEEIDAYIRESRGYDRV